MSNIKLWESVKKTSPSDTKTVDLSGMEMTTIDGYSMIRKATEMFGPLGIGWGYEIVEERWDELAPFYVKRSDDTEDSITSKTHTIRLKLWYKWDGERGELEQYGHTKAIYRSKWGATSDEETPKKSLMDAIKKSLSMLGFSADIFTGQYDDASYRKALEIEDQIEKAEDKDAEIEKKQAELTDYITRNLEAIVTAASKNEVSGIVKVVARHLERQKAVAELTKISERGIKALYRESAIKINQLTGDEKE